MMTQHREELPPGTFALPRLRQMAKILLAIETENAHIMTPTPNMAAGMIGRGAYSSRQRVYIGRVLWRSESS
jgi:hypothetical protein